MAYHKRTFAEYIEFLEFRWGKTEHSYPTESMGRGNPYYRCTYCKQTDPEISCEGHRKGCRWVQMFNSIQGLKRVLAKQETEKVIQ